MFSKIYEKYCSKVNKKKFRGVEIPLNYELTQKNKKLYWLDYKFQTNWLYELAAKYSLYRINKIIMSLKNIVQKKLF